LGVRREKFQRIDSRLIFLGSSYLYMKSLVIIYL
jgi:hypothetical protein